MKKLTTFLLILSACTIQFCFSQNIIITYPSLSNSLAKWFIETNDKGYLFLLSKYVGSFPKYAVIGKTDINGNLLWSKYINDGSPTFICSNIEQTLDMGYILCGLTFKYGGNNCDPIIIKLNSCGELEWCSVILTPGLYDYARRVKQTPGGDYIVLTSYSDPNEDYRIQLYKLNQNGDWVWKHNYPPIPMLSNEDGEDLTILDDGYLISANGYFPDPGQTGGGAYEKPYYIKTDSMGNDVWRMVYGAMNGYHGFIGNSTVQSSTGNFYSVGWHSNFCDTPALVKCTGSGSESYFQDLFPVACPGGNSAMNFLDDTTLVVMVGGTVSGLQKLKWIRTDTMGIEKFAREFPYDSFMVSTSSAIVTFDKKIVGLSDYNLNITLYKLNSNFEYDSVYNYPYVYDSACPYLIVSDTINPDCGLLVDVNEPEETPELTRLRARPNPVHDRLTVQFPEFLVIRQKVGQGVSSTTHNRWGTAELVAYDIFGTEVFAQTVEQSAKEAEIDVTGWKRGLYLFRLVFRNQTAGSVKVVVE